MRHIEGREYSLQLPYVMSGIPLNLDRPTFSVAMDEGSQSSRPAKLQSPTTHPLSTTVKHDYKKPPNSEVWVSYKQGFLKLNFLAGSFDFETRKFSEFRNESFANLGKRSDIMCAY